MVRESDLIDWIRRQKQFDPSLVPVGPGDDCAVVVCGAEKLLVSADQLLDGVHFDLKRHGAYAMGRKAMARALSDIAAMAGLPLAAVATVALPKGFSRADAEAMYRGMRDLSAEFDCPLVGGDVAASTGPAGVSVTVLGRPAGIQPVLRSGAKVGDAVCVTGEFGGSWLTDRHITFSPRVREARQLAASCSLHAMIDVSDGLALDLSRLCKASGVGAEVVADQVPVHPEAAAGRKIDPLRAALGDGEDYELLFALSAQQAEELLAAKELAVRVSRIATIIETTALTLILPDGNREQLKPEGWEHKT
ncbi:MAG: thiamine-phosphate kinase [Planctomycetota bacterium]|jgi:thiamine-monophosphate kinase